ncbi:unnamed protein product, partial [Oppiella nova]
MPQEIALFNILNYYGLIYGLKSDAINSRINELHELLDLPKLDKRIDCISGGQQRLVSLSVALIHSPKLLVLDEPTVGIDSLIRSHTTVIISTHYMEEAGNASHICFLYEGHCLAFGPPKQLLRAHGCTHLDDFSDNFKHRLLDYNDMTDNEIKSATIKVYVDMSETVVAYFGQITSMDHNPRAYLMPIEFSCRYFGDLLAINISHYLMPGFILGVIRTLNLIFTANFAFHLIHERKEGFLDRGLVAGINSMEIYVIQMLIGIASIVLCEWMASGVLWPHESLSSLLQNVLMIAPLTTSTQSLRYIAYRGWTLFGNIQDLGEIMAGYESERFVGLSAVDKTHYTCSICQDILCAPFCEQCIHNWLKTHNTCPNDLKTLTITGLLKPTRQFMNGLGKLQIRCDFKDKGCEQLINLEDLTLHTNSCRFRFKPQKCDKCLCDLDFFGHNCIQSLLRLNQKANQEIEAMKRQPMFTIPFVIGNNSQPKFGNTEPMFGDNNNLHLFEIILYTLTNDGNESTLKLGIYLLYKLSCDHTIQQKKFVSDFGVIDKILAIIDSKIQANVCDDCMEIGWALMWNLTDETPVNCLQFLENNVLLTNMTGLLANIAECQDMRTRLMTTSNGDTDWQTFLPIDCKRDNIDMALENAKYCLLLAKENGIKVLEELMKRGDIAPHIKQLCSLTLYQFELFCNHSNVDQLQVSDSIDIPTDFLSRLKIN